MKYINDFQKNQITGLLAKTGIGIFSDECNGDNESKYKTAELIKDIIVKINSNDIPVEYYDIVNNIISRFRQDDSCGIPSGMFSVIDDILTISQMHIDITKKEKSVTISVSKLSEQDSGRTFEQLRKRLSEVLSEYCAGSENPVKPENPEKKQENDDSIPEERFAKIVDRLYGMVHKPIPPLSDTTPSKKIERTFPDVKISEYAAIFDL